MHFASLQPSGWLSSFANRKIKDALRLGQSSSQQIASSFRPASRTRIAEILTTLTAIGQAQQHGDRFSL